MARETALEERTRQDAEKAAENLKRQVRLGDVPRPSEGEEVATEEGTEEEPKRGARSRKK